jgi:hypothetical protein
MTSGLDKFSLARDLVPIARHSVIGSLLAVDSKFLLLVALLCISPGIAQQDTELKNPEANLLELRLVAPPQWKDDCLQVELDRKNRSSLPLFLPAMGLFISTSVNELDDVAATEVEQKWVNVYGSTDVIILEATSLAPGATLHEEGCLSPHVFVVNIEKGTRRAIPLRGRLQIEAYYFLSEKEWQTFKSSREEMMSTKPDSWGAMNRQDPKVVTIFAKIPCRDGSCGSVCDAPPLILKGEDRIVPDVFYIESAFGVRGEALSRELALNSPSCTEGMPGAR